MLHQNWWDWTTQGHVGWCRGRFEERDWQCCRIGSAGSGMRTDIDTGGQWIVQDWQETEKRQQGSLYYLILGLSTSAAMESLALTRQTRAWVCQRNPCVWNYCSFIWESRIPGSHQESRIFKDGWGKWQLAERPSCCFLLSPWTLTWGLQPNTPTTKLVASRPDDLLIIAF